MPELDSGAIRRYYETSWDSRSAGETSLFSRMRCDATRSALAHIRETLDQSPGRLLEIGPGLGEMTRAWAAEGRRVTVMDLAFPILAALRTSVAGTQADAGRLPFRSGCFDVLHADSVLMHCDLHRSAAEFRRVLADGGRAVFAEPLAGNPWMRVWRRLDRTYSAIARWHSLAEIEAAMSRRFRRVRVEPLYLNPPLTFLPRPLRAHALALDALMLRMRPDLAWIAVVVADA